MVKSLYCLPSKVANMNHLTQEQRYTISVMREQGYSQKDIAKAIQKDKSTVSRELRRNCDMRNGNYSNVLAHHKYVKRQKAKPKHIKFTAKMQRYIDKKLELKWSPEQISSRSKAKGRPMVSHERIYQYIIEDKKKGGNKWTHLRRKKRYKRRCVTNDRRGKLKNTKNISERPSIAQKRKVFGHFEIDLIIGLNGVLLTINDLKTGKVIIRKLKSKNAMNLAKAVIKALKKLKINIYTMTSDNGKEFSEHEYISRELGIDFYFADPYSSWQRGANENLNGLIRQYFPKKTNFANITWKEVKRVENDLNNRPRKRLGFLTPNEVFINLTKVAFAA
jgi:transposase, IS30 family